jgi:hypothetical protein
MFGFCYPDETLTLINRIKSRLRQNIVQREGERKWSQIARDFRRKSIKDGYSSILVDDLLEEYRERVILKLGNQLADEILGD